MNYTRVIPRDLFNEANLLKCYGQLALYFNDYRYSSNPEFKEPDGNEGFIVMMDDNSGETWIDNLQLYIGGKLHRLYRPMNSREPWPLYVSQWDWEEPSAVFNDDGTLSPEMLQLLNA
jgi:hypothetical protein